MADTPALPYYALPISATAEITQSDGTEKIPALRADGSIGHFTPAQLAVLTAALAVVRSVAGRTGDVVLAEADIAGLAASLAAKAPLASPALTGVPTAPTAALGTDTAQIATMAALQAALAALTDAAPGALDTLNELAAALGDDANFAATMTAALAGKQAMAEKGAANGYAALDGAGKVPSAQLPPGGNGDVVGPVSATDDEFALFNGITGKLLKGAAAVPVAKVTGLQTALDGKSATGHSHAISDTTGLQTALDGKSATGHSHAISDTTGLQTALDGKAATSHSHAISDTTGLQTALDGKPSIEASSVNTTTDYAIGTMLMVTSAGPRALNSTLTLRRVDANTISDGATGTALAGVWRTRGTTVTEQWQSTSENTYFTYYTLYQRVS